MRDTLNQRNSKAVIVHANWMVGNKNKMNALKNNGFWLVGDNITIQNNSNSLLQQITIINLQGDIVLTKNIMVLPNATINLSVAQLPSGTYVIKLMDNYFTTLVISK